MASKPALWPPETTSFGKRRGGQFGEGQVGGPDRPPTAQCRHERDSGGEEVGRELVGIAADRLQEADHPLVVGKVQVPDPTNGFDEWTRLRVVLPQGERGRLEQRQRPRRFGSAGRGEHDAQSAVGMADEMGTVAHQLGDVVGVDQEVLAVGDRAPPVAAPVEDEQTKALVGQWSLGLPFLDSGGQ